MSDVGSGGHYRDAQSRAISAYWEAARSRAGLTRLAGVAGQQALSSVEPPAWSFGTTVAEADNFLELVLAGVKTATSSAAGVYAKRGEPLPDPGDLSIVLDGHGRPRALVATTVVEVVSFRDVGVDHAMAEGEGDRTLSHWRQVHEAFLRAELAAEGKEFSDNSEVVLERFRLLDPPQRRSHDPVTATPPATTS